MNKEFTQEEADRHNELTGKAWKIIEDYILLLNVEEKKIGFWGKRKLNKAIKYFNQALEIAPDQYSTKWGLGKIYQALGENEQSLFWFEETFKLEKENPDVCREATLAALDSDQPEKALFYSDASLKLSPEDAGLLCNRSLIYMIMKQDDKALKFIEKALQIDPEDQITLNVQNILNDIIEGKRTRPKSMTEL